MGIHKDHGHPAGLHSPEGYREGWTHRLVDEQPWGEPRVRTLAGARLLLQLEEEGIQRYLESSRLAGERIRCCEDSRNLRWRVAEKESTLPHDSRCGRGNALEAPLPHILK